MSIATEINRPDSVVFRRAHIKRRQTSDGLYETNWQSITPYIKGWGAIESSLDEPRLNRFTHSGITLRARNDTGAFNAESMGTSLWNGHMPRYRTLVRVQAGYEDTDGSDLPTDSTQGIFILDKPVPIAGQTNDVQLQCASLRSIFEDVRARDVVGLGVNASAGAIVATIKGHTDGAGSGIFTQFISSGAWTIDSNSANLYTPATDTSLEDKSVADLLDKISEDEGKVWFIDKSGGFHFEARPTATGTASFSFYGQGFPRQNIIRFDEYYEDLNNLYTYVRLKYLEPATSSSYATAGTTTSVNASNLAWKYGQRAYEFECDFIPNTATAQTIADNLLALLSVVRNKAKFQAKMCPQLDIHDSVFVNYRSYDIATQPLWNTVDWDSFKWAQEGQNFDWTDRTFRVVGKRLNLDDFKHEFTVREV